MAKIMLFSFIVFTHSGLKHLAAETPIKTSLSLTHSSKLPTKLLGLVKAANSSFYLFIFTGLFLYMDPLVSHIIIFLIPIPSKSVAIYIYFFLINKIFIYIYKERNFLNIY
jgi:hypothetical protein